MKTPRTLPVAVRALFAALALSAAARAGTWSITEWTGDSTTHIAAGETLWAYRFDSTTGTTINGVAVIGIAGGNPAVAGQFAVGNTPNTIGGDHSNELTRAGLGGSAEMAKRFIYNGTPTQVNIEGLTAGQTYTVSFFGVDWANATRVVTFESLPDSLVVDEHQFGNERGIRVDYTFLATASTRFFTIAPQVFNTSWHFYGLALRQEAAPTVVTNTNDAGTGSLRWALANAAAISGADTITFDASLSGATITTLTELTIADAGGVTIDASALAAPVTIAGGGFEHRLITHTAGALTLRRLRLTGGVADVTPAFGPYQGGAVRSTGATLSAIDCTFHGCSAGSGGALYLATTGAALVEGCTLRDNAAIFDLGAAGTSAAITNGGALTVRKSTFATNLLTATPTGPSAGAIFNEGSLVLEHCTMTDNGRQGATGSNGAVYLRAGGGVSATITNCILSENRDGPDVANATGSAANLTYAGANIVLTQANALFTGPAPLTGNPLLGPIGANGGVTDTRVPQFGSPAIDAASVIAGHPTDQRGLPRTFDGDGDGTSTRDIGSVESRIPIVSNTASSGTGSLVAAAALGFANSGPDTIVFRPASFPAGSILDVFGGVAIPPTDTIDTSVPGGAVDIAVNWGTWSFSEGSAWAGSGRLLLGATSGTASATIGFSEHFGTNTVAVPIVVRAGSTGAKTISPGDTGTNTLSGPITLEAPLTVLSGDKLIFTGDVDLGPHQLNIWSTLNGDTPIEFHGRVYRSDGIGIARMVLNGTGRVRLAGTSDNTRLAATVNGGGLLLDKTSGAAVRALGSGLTAADGPALTFGTFSNIFAVAVSANQFADTASVLISKSLSFDGDQTFDALDGDGTIDGRGSPGSPFPLTIGAGNGSGTFEGQLSIEAIGVFGFGELRKVGTGTQTFRSNPGFLPDVRVTGGTLNILGASVGETTVQNGAVLSGSAGYLLNFTWLETGSFVSPGDSNIAGSIGTLHLFRLSWAGGAVARFHLSATDSSSDSLSLQDILTRTGTGPYLFDFQGTGGAGQVYTLATFSSSNFAVTDFSYTGLAPGLVGYFTKTATSLTFTTTTFSPVVTSTADSGPGSLRQVLLDAAQIPGADVITFPPALSGATITLGSELLIDDASGGVTLDATSLTDGLTIDGGPGANRLFNVTAGDSLTLRGVTLTGGNGGGGSGGAITNAGTATLERCTLFGNSATSGGAVFNSGTLSLLQCTLAENSASAGGAVASQGGQASLFHCTVSRNTATTSGGGIANLSGDLTLGGNIVAGNTAPNGDVANAGNPIVTGGAANMIGGDPRLAVLAHNGGPTRTMALRRGSPAIDPAGIVVGGLATDQRGLPRSRDGDNSGGGVPDLGAYEAQVAPVSGVGFNFVGGGIGGPGGTLAAADVAGVPQWAQGNWNNLSTEIDGAAHDGTYPGNGPVPLVNSSGVAFSPNLRVWWAAHHLWNISNAFQSTPSRRLMNGYLDSNNAGPGHTGTNLYGSFASQPFFAVAGLPILAGGYKVLVYTDGDATDRVGEYWLTTNRNANPANVASESDLTPHVFVRDASNFFDTFTRVPSTSTTNLGLASPAGNYVAFEGLTEPGFIVRAEEAYVSAPINAVQVVPNEIVVVTTAADELDPNGTPGTGLSLREALRDAPSGAGILFDSALSGATITLDAAKGELVLAKDVTIDASTLPGGVTIHGGAGANRVFTVSTGKAVTLIALTLTSGDATGDGGAVLNHGWLTVNRCTFSGNTATGAGGAIHTDGTTARLHATRSTFAGNTGTGTVSNDTDATTTLTHCTVSANSSGVRQVSGTFTVAYSIAAGNTAADTSGTITQTGANFLSVNPQLAAVASNGGPTQTMALLPGSPARNAATGSLTTSDQRGSPIVGVPDLGAYEANDTPTTNYSAWSLATAGSVLPSTDDTENDGAINALEYALRRNPQADDSTLNPTLTGPSGNRTFAFRYQPTASDLRYIVQRNTDLNNAAGWTEIYRFDLTTGIITEHPSITADENGTTQIITLFDPAPGARLFWRLRIELLP